MKLNVADMSCGHCKASITGAIAKLDPNANVEFDLATKTVAVDSRKSATEISDALDQIGFPSTVVAG